MCKNKAENQKRNFYFRHCMWPCTWCYVLILHARALLDPRIISARVGTNLLALFIRPDRICGGIEYAVTPAVGFKGHAHAQC